MTTPNQKAQTMHLPLDGGMDQRTHPRHAQAPTTLQAVNVRYRQLGGATKRNGSDRIGSVFTNADFVGTPYTMVPGAGKLIGFDNELLVTDGYRLGSYTTNAAQKRIIDKGKVPEAISRITPIDSTQYAVAGQDVCWSTDNLLFHAFVGAGYDASGSGAIYSTVEDLDTGANIVSSVQMSNGGFTYYMPHLLAVGAEAYCFFADPIVAGVPGPNIYACRWNRTTLKWGTQVILRTDNRGDLAVCTDGTSIFLFHKRLSDSKMVTISYDTNLNSISAAISSQAAVIGGGTGFTLDICAISANKVWAVWVKQGVGVDVYAAAYDLSLGTETTAPITLYTQPGIGQATVNVARLTTTDAVASIGKLDASGEYWAMFPRFNTGGTITGSASATARRTYWSFLASKPFVLGAGTATSPLRSYVWLYSGGADMGTLVKNKQYTLMLVDIGADEIVNALFCPRPISWQAPRYASPGDNQFAQRSPPSVVNAGNGKWYTDATIKRNARSRISLSRALADFQSGDRFFACRLGQTMFMNPGFYYDKSGLAEVSFAYYPQGITAANSTTGGVLGNNVTRTYRAMYEFVDANGFVHRSVPSDQVTITTPAAPPQTTGSISIKVPALDITMRQIPFPVPTGVRIVIYVLNTTTGLFERLFNEGTEPLNDPRAQFVTAVDTGTPTTEPFPEILYTETGVYPNVMPAGFTSCVTYRNRVWIAYGNTVAYSKAFVTGDTVNFTDAFELPLEETGYITALAVMGDTLYIGTVDRIYFLQADGPNDFGQGSAIDTPNRIEADVGIVDQRSVAVTQVGMFYQSPVGLQRMQTNRVVDTEPLGSRVQNDLARFNEIAGTNVHPSGRYVTFSCRNAALEGARLVYDYTLDRWSRDTVVSDQTDFGNMVLSEATAGGKLFYMYYQPSTSVVMVESSTTNLDDSIWVPMLVELAEIHPSGLQSEVSFMNWVFMNETHTPHDLTLSFTKNYEAAPFDSRVLGSALIASQPEQYDVMARDMIAQSMHVTIRDGYPSAVGAVVGTGKGATFIGLAVNIDTMGTRTFRAPAGEKL